MGAGEGRHHGGPHGDDLANGQRVTHMDKGHAHSIQREVSALNKRNSRQTSSQDLVRFLTHFRASRLLLQGSQNTGLSPVAMPWNLEGTNGKGKKDRHQAHQDSGPGRPGSHSVRVRAGF